MSHSHRIRQSVQRSVFPGSTHELIAASEEMGIEGIDMLDFDEWPLLSGTQLICSLTPTHSPLEGICDAENHEQWYAVMEQAIERTSEAEFPTVVCFSGVQGDIDEDQAHTNCVTALKRIARVAERHQVTVCLELISQKRFEGYFCGSTARGVAICREVGSERIRLLYDIYQMQRSEGDIIETLRQNIDYIAHVHTGGVPGRHELNDTQELNYRTIVGALRDLGYTGFIGHEFNPTGDPVQAFKEAVSICRA